MSGRKSKGPSRGLEGPQRKIRAVLDTNVLISAWFWKGNESRLVELVEEGAIDGYTSPDILDELRRALRYPKFKLDEDEVEAIYNYYLLILKVVEPRSRIDVVKEDPEDNRVLECAVEAKADYIITGDRHLLGLKDFQGIRIVRAGELLGEL